jgi:hypothetical protein
VIVYALEKIISYARDNQYIFLVQSIWWKSSIIGLQQGLVVHNDNLKRRSATTPRGDPHQVTDEVSQIDMSRHGRVVSAIPPDVAEDTRIYN